MPFRDAMDHSVPYKMKAKILEQKDKRWDITAFIEVQKGKRIYMKINANFVFIRFTVTSSHTANTDCNVFQSLTHWPLGEVDLISKYMFQYHVWKYVVYLRPALRIDCRGDHLWKTVDRSLPRLTGAFFRAWLRLRHGAFWGCAPAPLTKLDLIDWLIDHFHDSKRIPVAIENTWYI